MTAIQELVDAKIVAAEARTDSKFGQLIGEMQLMNQLINQRLDHLEGQMQSLRGNIWTATSIVIGSMIGIIAILATVMPWTFDTGAATHEQVAREVAAQAARK